MRDLKNITCILEGPLKNSDLRCPLPWVHLATRNDGSTRLCCHSDTGKHLLNLNKTPSLRLDQMPFQQILESDHWKKTRHQMESGEWPEECHKCERDEKLHGHSKRTREKLLWPKGVYSKPLVRELDLRFGNLCNLACVTCSTGLSSRWVSLYQKMKNDIKNPKLLGYLKNMNENPQFQLDSTWCQLGGPFWDHLKNSASNLERIYFSGGEPLIQEEHEHCLDLLIRSGRATNISLRYSTNGTYITSQHLEKWKSFKEVNLSLSIDSYGSKNDYIRFGSQWEKVLNNLKSVSNVENIFVSVTKSIQVYNAYYILDFLRLFNEDGNLKNIPIHFNFVHFPSFLTIQAMPAKLKELVRVKLSSFEEKYGYKEKINSVINYMLDKDQSEMWSYFLDYTESLDRLRGTDFLKVFPDYKPFMKTNHFEKPMSIEVNKDPTLYTENRISKENEK